MDRLAVMAKAVVNFFYWHQVVRDYYFMAIMSSYGKENPTKYVNETMGGEFKFIKEHGNSIWAKIDVICGKIRIWLMVVIIIVMFALMVGWRP